jgi:translation initiation factor IF-3
VNEQVRADTIRLIGPDGDQLGIVSRDEALEEASNRELDLVEVAPDANPTVCKLLDYGKFKYRQKKKRQGQKHHRSRLKEMQIGLNTQEHDLAFKADQVREFLQDHDKVLVFMRLRGREKAHVGMALDTMAEFAQRFEDIAQIERGPERASAGRITMLLKPK